MPISRYSSSHRLGLSMSPQRQDDIMDIDSGDSDASLDYDVPRRKGKGKAPKKKDKGKGKVTEVSVIPGQSKAAVDFSSGECSRRICRSPTHGRRPMSGLGIRSRRMSLGVSKLQ